MPAFPPTPRGLLAACLIGTSILLASCEAPIIYQTPQDRQAISAAVAAEKPGNYYIGYRFYKVDYHIWGWVKNPGQPWKDSQLVMFNEQKKLAPDREHLAIGSDNNIIYKLTGFF